MRVVGTVAALLFFIACVGEDPDITPSSSGSSSGGPSARTVQCNDKICESGSVCCLTFGDSAIERAECTPEASCATPFLSCDGAGDCEAGQICCVGTGGNSVQYGPSYCAIECTPGSSDIQLCRESAECASKSCVTTERSVTPTNLKVCTK
jgi:hypothetical protein